MVLYDKFYIQLFCSIISLRHADFRGRGEVCLLSVLLTPPRAPASYRVPVESQTGTRDSRCLMLWPSTPVSSIHCFFLRGSLCPGHHGRLFPCPWITACCTSLSRSSPLPGEMFFLLCIAYSALSQSPLLETIPS